MPHTHTHTHMHTHTHTCTHTHTHTTHTHTHTNSNTVGVGTPDSGVVAGRIAAVNITLRYRNRGMQDAFGTILSFNQQEAVFSQYLLRINRVGIYHMTDVHYDIMFFVIFDERLC